MIIGRLLPAGIAVEAHEWRWKLITSYHGHH